MNNNNWKNDVIVCTECHSESADIIFLFPLTARVGIVGILIGFR